MSLSSRLLENAVDQLATLPGIGRRTAMRLALDLLRREPQEVARFSDAIKEMREQVRYCEVCCNISDSTKCAICKDPSRDGALICVVEDIRDVIAIENTRQFKGLNEVILALGATLEGDTTAFYLNRRLSETNIQVSTIARGISVGGDLDQADELTLGRSIADRKPYEHHLKR